MNMTESGFYFGVVEERETDKYKLGRCRVRIVGVHTEDEKQLPTKDLPWAYPLQPGYSAAMNGIGQAPVGYVEGTWVMVIFRDQYKQQPVILGSFGGIPEKPKEFKNTVFSTQTKTYDYLATEDGTPVTDGSGNPIITGGPTPPVTQGPIKKPGALKVSKAGEKFMKDREALSSLSPTENKFVKSDTTLPDNTPVYAYKDPGGVWTIGWGNTYYADGSPVKEGDSITKGEADKLYSTVKQQFADKVNQDLKVPVTQSMFDALVDMSYNMGHAGLTKSAMFSSLNAGKYEEAAALIPSTRATVKGKPNKGLSNRRELQKSKFLEDGIPSQDMSTVKDTPEKQAKVIEDKTKNPAVLGPPSQQEQNNTLTGTGSSTTDEKEENKKTQGFMDPNKVYPKKEFYEEPDTNRLARHEKIDQTIVKKKESARVKNVKTARKETWDQPKIPYNALYPYNLTFMSESGHIEEFDDTKDNERMHRYHKTGTFEEIDKNGTRVTRIVGDDYEILERHGHVLIKGNCFVTIQGDSRVKIENDAYIEVLGNSYTDVTGNMEVSVKGDYKLKAKNVKVESYGEEEGDGIDIVAVKDIAADGKGIYLNSKVSSPTYLVIPEEEATGKKEFSKLEVPDRREETKANYEIPDEGDSTEFIWAMVEAGIMSPEEVKPQVIQEVPEGSPPKEEETPAEEKPPVKPPTKKEVKEGCAVIYGEERFTSGFQLTEGWTLGDVVRGRSGIPNGTHYGKTANEIVCNLKGLTENVIDPIKKKYPNMIITNSWRSQEVNDSLRGSSKTSQHLSGEAVDIQFSGFDRRQTYEAAIEIQKMLPQYDQMLLEYSGDSMWLHISHKNIGNRMDVRTIDVFNSKNNVAGGFKLYGA